MTSDEKRPTLSDQDKRLQPLPRIGETAWVWCDGYRTLARLDPKGVWRTVATGKELTGVVSVIREQ